MIRPSTAACVVAAFAVALPSAGQLRAETTAAQRRQVQEIGTSVRRAVRLADDGDSRAAYAETVKIHKAVKELLGDEPDPDLIKILAPALASLKDAQALLALEGYKLPPVPSFAATTTSTTTPEPSSDGISFSKQVAPLLVSKCGRCHIGDNKGTVSMSTYASLMQGSQRDGVIIFPGKGAGSRMIEVIESGDMPRGGGKISKEEMDLLVKWIDQGAKNDAGNANAPLMQLARTATAAPKVEVAQATGDETIKFSLDVAGVLTAQCGGCHGTQRPRAGFSVNTFASFLRGGDSGPVIMPGKPADSLLVQKLKGQAGDRMPLQRPPLPDATIAKIEKWIEEGAKFDGDDQQTTLARLASVARARTLNADELSKERMEIAARNWRLAIPDEKANTVATDNFLMVGNVGEATLKEIGGQAEAQVPKIGSALKMPVGDQFIKGRLTIFVFANPYDYEEFGTMVERREIPRAWKGHWRFDEVDPYILVVQPRSSEEYSLDVLLAQLMASVYVANHAAGSAPHWLAEGAGRAVAARINKNDPRVAQWDDEIKSIIATMRTPADFMTGKLPPEHADIISYSFVDLMMSQSTKFKKALDALGEGANLDQALAVAYKSTKGQMALAWGARAARGR